MRSRALTILAAVVKEYVNTCAPVGSKALVDHHDMGVSSATVRSDLAGLERSGHLMHPYVSAGRIPTDLGYRTVVNRQPSVATTARFGLFQDIWRSTSLHRLSQALAKLTRCVAVVTQPEPQSKSALRLSLTSVREDCVMLVLVLEHGQVASRALETTLSRAEISRVEEVAAELVVGESVPFCGDYPELSPAAESFLQRVLRAAQSLVTTGQPKVPERSGMALLLAQPEFKDSQLLCGVVEALEDEKLLWEATLFCNDEGLVVSIGQENADERLQAMSIVAKEYHALAGVGSVACVGPTRMDYPLVMGAVEAGAQRACAIGEEELL